MSQANKPGFFRPVEIRSGVNDTIECTVLGGGGAVSVTINAGTYSSMPAITEAWTTAINASQVFTRDGCTATCYIYYGEMSHGIGDSETILYYDVYATFSFTTSTALDFQNTTTHLMFGFPSQTSSSSVLHVGSKPTEYKWIPVFQSGVQSVFQLDKSNSFSGIQVKSGGLSGVKTGPDVHYLDCAFYNEPGQNIVESRVSASTYLYHTAEYFFDQARHASPAVSGNARCNGFFYVPNMNNIHSGSPLYGINVIPGGTDGDTWTYEGVRFHYDSSPDLYTYCSIDKGGFADASPTAPTGLTYWQIDLRINRDTDIPTFKAPDQT